MKKLGRRKEHKKSLRINLAINIINCKRIETTFAKAKMVQPFVEKLITKAKTENLHSQKLLNSKLFNNNKAVEELFLVGKSNLERNGGYTRIVKLIGDRCIIELVNEVVKSEKNEN